jgi:hypothetical protein
VTLIGKHPSKLARAKHLRLPTAFVSDVSEEEADIVVDCTGSAEGFERALSLVRPQGTIVVKSTYHGEPPRLTAPIVVDEIKIIGSRCGPFAPALQAISEGKVEVVMLIDATYPLSDVQQAVEHAGRRGALKVLVRSSEQLAVGSEQSAVGRKAVTVHCSLLTAYCLLLTAYCLLVLVGCATPQSAICNPQSVEVWGKEAAAEPGNFVAPRAVAVDDQRDLVYIVDSSAGSFSSSGARPKSRRASLKALPSRPKATSS